ncbi:MAG: 50S ribosomal protein L28 [Atribacterota bacterium]|jgi:large subunit ribosomal protein L28|nr:50S ribosomal protein L28 [Actinomycetota bacterium]
MAKCEICDKGPQFGNKISHSHRVTNRMWHPNIQKVKVHINNTIKTINVCTKCLKAGKVKKSV